MIGLPAATQRGRLYYASLKNKMAVSCKQYIVWSSRPTYDRCLWPYAWSSEFECWVKRLSYLSDLCLLLTDLNLENDILGDNLEHNFAAISLLRNLKVINLSRNRFTRLSTDLFHNMRDLQIVYLADNALSHLDQHIFAHNGGLTKLYLNRIRIFNVSLIEPTKDLSLLDIADNHITRFNQSFINFMERSTGLQTVLLGGNPFDCTCGHKNFRDWLQKTPLVHSVNDLDCATTANNEANEDVFNYEEDFFLCNVQRPLTITVGVVVAILAAVFVSIPCYRYKWYITHIQVVMRAVRDGAIDVKDAEECKYDAMICCNKTSSVDMKFAKDLLQKLEEGDYSALSDNQEDDRVSRGQYLYILRGNWNFYSTKC